MKLRIYPSENTNFEKQMNFLNETFHASEYSIGEILGWENIKITRLISLSGEKSQRVLDLTGPGVKFEKIYQTKKLIGFENFETHFVGKNRCGFRIETEHLFINFTTNREDFDREWVHVMDLLLGRGGKPRPSFENLSSMGFSEDQSERFLLDYKRYNDDFTVVDQWDFLNDWDEVRWKKRTTLTVELHPHQRGTKFGELWHEEISEILRTTGLLTQRMIQADNDRCYLPFNVAKKHLEGFREQSQVEYDRSGDLTLEATKQLP
jgi:hypothetical protein